MTRLKQNTFATALFGTIWAMAAGAQTVPGAFTAPERGMVPWGSYSVSQIEAIDGVSGNLGLHIPLAQLPPGPAGMAAMTDLRYNSSIYQLIPILDPNTGGQTGQTLLTSGIFDPLDTGGWRYGFEHSVTWDVGEQSGNTCGQTAIITFRYRVITPDGASHVLYNMARNDDFYGYYIYGYDPCAVNPSPATLESGNITFATADGSYIRLVMNAQSSSWTLYYPDGRVIRGTDATTTSMSDRNGNTVTISGNLSANQTTTVLQDSVGRTITIARNSLNGGTDTITQNGYPQSGVTPTLQWTVTWEHVGLSSGHTYYCGTSVQFCEAGSGGQNLGWIAVSRVDLPTPGLSYQFCYDPVSCSATVPASVWGQINKMTLPSGATVTYQFPQPSCNWDCSGAADPVSQKVLSWTDENLGNTPRTETSTYSFTTTSSTFTNPDGSTVTRSFYDRGQPAGLVPLAGLVYSTQNQPSGETLEQQWTQNVPYGGSGRNPSYRLPGNPAVAMSVKSESSQISAPTIYSYDRNGNVKQQADYGWIPYGNVTRSNGVVTGFSGGAALRSTVMTYLNGASAAISGSAGASANDTLGYWNALTPQIVNLPSFVSVSGIGPGSVTELQYDNGSLAHGNVTQQRQWDSALGSVTTPLTASNAAIANYVYDGRGNVTLATDPRGLQTQTTYDTDGKCATAITQGSGTRHFSFGACDANTSLIPSATDSDHGITRSYGYDPYGRLNAVTETGGGLTRKRSIQYFDSSRYITESADVNGSGDYASSTISYFDQLGRTRKTVDAAGNQTLSSYYTPANGGASYRLASNLFLTGSESSMAWTLTTLDTLGRVTAVQHCANIATAAPSPVGTAACNSTGTATTSYSTSSSPVAFQTTAGDEAAVSTVALSDALGQMVQATQNGSENTGYTYDALGNLTAVTQSGVNGRSFSYSSLSRLLSATNPESGLTCYGYDADGNLSSRRQGASSCSPASGGITTTWAAYDNLNQATGKSYSDGTVSVSYGYNVDWLTTTTSGSNVFRNLTFDGFGRVTSSSQTTGGMPTYAFGSYSYNLLDGLTSMTMPSNRVINTPRDSANRVTSVSSGATTYSSSIGYAPHGAVKSMALGNTLNSTMSFNSRLQAGSMLLGTSAGASDIWSLSNTFSGTQNNGNVLGQTLGVPGMGTLNSVYTYDGVNRLSVAAENSSNPANPPCPDASSQWCRSYGYYAGGYGNRKTANVSGQGLSTLEPATFNANNQIADAGWSYLEHGSVTRGNVTQQKNGATFAYDAEGNQVAYCPNDANPVNCSQTAGNGRTLYYYDGDGRRVETVAADGTTTVFVYDAGGNLAAEYGSQPALPCSTCYVTADYLGSTRVVTDGSGCAVWRSDYLPFGESVLTSGGSPRSNATGGTKCSTNGYLASMAPVRLQFTGKERDAETGLDYFGARYMSSAQGRFTSPDPLGASATVYDPQSWNRYIYVRNNPLRFIDPTGLAAVSAQDCQSDSQCVNVKVNAIYDRGANSGAGLTDKQKAAFEGSLLKEAKSQFGEAKIHLDVGYTAGGYVNGKIEGAVTGSLNVIVSDSNMTLSRGVSYESAGFAVTVLNMNAADSSTLAHEMAHHFMGDTIGLANTIAEKGGFLGQMFGMGADVVADIRNDYERFRVGIVGPYFGNRFDPPPGQPLPLTTPLNQGAKRFQAPLTQEAIRPRQ